MKFKMDLKITKKKPRVEKLCHGNFSLVLQQSRIIALCAYRDMSGMFTIENKASCSAKEDAVIRSHSEAETIIQDLRWDAASLTVTADHLSFSLSISLFVALKIFSFFFSSFSN